jgi:hypothetical protein
MRGWKIVLSIGAAIIPLAIAAGAQAQQSHVGLGFHSGSDSFSENMGTTWGFNSHGLNFNFGGGFQTTPGAATFGFSSVGPAGTFNFFATAGQSSGRSLSSQSPGLTTMNGQTGFVSDTSLTPFVMGVVPVVGSLAPMASAAPAVADASAVQLPTFGMFGASTSVWVPDQGAASLGGVSSASGGQIQAGLPGLRNSAFGSSRTTGNSQVRATVHDFQKADAALLGAGAGMSFARREDPAARALAGASSSTAGQAAPSVAEARRLHEAEQDAQNAEAQQWFDRGQAAEQDAKPAAAKIYYQMAVRRASGELKQSALDRLEALRGEPAATMARKPAP